MSDGELLAMLAKESDRRVPAISKGLAELADAGEPDSEKVEAMRVEVHGLKGAAMVIGQSNLAELAERSERALADRTEPGTVSSNLVTRITSAVEAFHDGAKAAAAEEPEPASVGEALALLR